MRGRYLLGSFVLLGVVACGDETHDDGDAGTVATSSTGGMAGQGGAGGGAPSCLDIWVDTTMEPDPSGPNTQIHGTSTFDGAHVWMAWSRPDGASLFDVWLAAFACDGTMAVAPLEVTQSDDNELDPVMAVSGDRLLVAWMSDNGTGIDNLDIRYRVFGLDGAPLTDAIELQASRGGVAVTGNALSPSVAATTGGFILAGSWGHADALGFQAFAVKLDRDGVVQGDADDGELNPAVGQTAVAVAVDGDDVFLAWQEDTTSTAPVAKTARLGDPAALLADPGARPHVAPGPWHAWDGDGADIVVMPPGGTAMPLGLSGFVHSPRIERADGESVLLWLEVVSGIQNRVHVAPLGSDGSLGPLHTLASEDVPSVYPVDLTLVDATHAVVVYQDGASPDFRLKAEWLTLEP